ncbi:hypothetical protein AB9K34_09585 [Sedimentitalea sp. XS_ASV28]|uniref:hypothetical protein n=1 Tax=Sedimentitalea sp. XS_ASV28 TaxID=3241296 RepID=UPI003512900A
MSVAAAFAVVGTAALGALYIKGARHERSRRAILLDNCLDLISRPEITLEQNGYPVLSGKRDGYEAELKLLADTIQLRKLPVLWLIVTVRRPLPIPGVLDMMLRANNTEYYSPHGELDETIPLPEGWNDQMTIRSDNAEAVAPLLDRLKAQVEYFNEEARGKEILITPKGIRLIYRIDESDRGHYLVTRLPKFENGTVDRETADRLLAQAKAIGDIVEGSLQ